MQQLEVIADELSYKQHEKNARRNVLFKFWTKNFKTEPSEKLGLLYILLVIKLYEKSF